MSRTLTFAYAEAALAAARTLAANGRTRDALARVELALQGTPSPAAETYRFAAELCRELERYGRARRHLRMALAVRPHDAALHHDLGLALQDDPYGCDRRAAGRFRKAVALAPENPTYRAALGLALVRLNRVSSGIAELKKAVELAPTDAAVMGTAVTALREADRPHVAVRWLTRSLFLAPNQPELRQLLDRARFDLVRADQTADRRIGRGPVNRPATVPFVRIAPVSAKPGVGGGVVRRDMGSRPAPHLGRIQAYRAGG